MDDKTIHIKLDKLNLLCKGDRRRELKYIQQFSELIPLSIDRIRECLINEKREQLNSEIHHVMPQLVFFGIEDFSDVIEKIKSNSENSYELIQSEILDILKTLDMAVIEADILIENLS